MYQQMEGWLGYGKAGQGEEGIPYWFSYYEEEKFVSASVEPSGLQFTANMEMEEWIAWKIQFKQLATKNLGLEVEEIC